MPDSTTAEAEVPSCTRGHLLTPDNIRPTSERAIRCRICAQESKAGLRATDPDAARKRAAELRRTARAKMREEDPARYADAMAASRKRKAERLKSLTREEQHERWQNDRLRKGREAAIRHMAKRMNVTITEYNALLNESTISEDDLVRDQNRPSAAWNLLKVKGDALPVWDEFSLHLETTVTPCQGSLEFTEFDDPRPGRDDENIGKPMPTRAQAAQMCEKCPLIDLCARFAIKDKPDFGIWGGKIWLGGKAQ